MPEFVVPAFIRIRTGLLEPKHVARMGGGSPMVLYLYLQTRVRFRGDGAGTTIDPYTHEQAAEDLGVKPRAVREWFATLRHNGYISVRKLQYGLEVTITNYDPDHAPQLIRLPSQRQAAPDQRATTTAVSPAQTATTASVSSPQTAVVVAADCHPDGGRLPSQRQSPSLVARES